MKRKARFIFVGYGNDRVFSIQILKSNFTFRMPGGLFQIDLKVKYCTISCLVTRSCVLISFLKYMCMLTVYPTRQALQERSSARKRKVYPGEKAGHRYSKKKKPDCFDEHTRHLVF